jgi:hypothetical protein
VAQTQWLEVATAQNFEDYVTLPHTSFITFPIPVVAAMAICVPFLNHESMSGYRPGGFHPVRLGDTFKDGRYKIHVTTVTPSR